jgi:parallel beta-helix repeat protein
MVVRFSKIAFTITILLVNLFFTTRIFGQGNETYYAVIDTTLTQVSIPPYTASQIVVWSNSAAKSIPLYFWNWNTDSLPSSLPPNKAENQVNEAGAVWSSASSSVFGFSTGSPAVYIFFTKNTNLFPPGEDMAGATYDAVEYNNNASRDLFSVYTSNPETWPSVNPQSTYIAFNNGPSFYAKNYQWEIDTTFLPYNGICFMQVALHELGHLIGIGDDGSTTGINDAGSVMDLVTPGADFHGLSSEDESALSTVESQTITGIGGGGGGSRPPAPTGFAATIVGQDVVLSWNPDPIGAEASYSVTRYYNGNGTVISPPNYTSTSFIDQGAANDLPQENNAFYYFVTATNSYGNNSTQGINVAQVQSTINVGGWSGVVYVNGSVIVPYGLSLTIAAGTKIIFNAGHNYSITANYPLFVNGLAYAPVIFTSNSTSPSSGDWGSMVLNSAANNSTLSYANIQYGTEVDVTGANSVTIQNCNITNNAGDGINLNNSSNCTMQNNTIANANINHGIFITNGTGDNCYWNVIYKTNHNQSGAGILYNSASGTVGENDVDWYSWGIAGMYWASPSADYWPPNGKNNRVTNCQFGLLSYYQSNCNFGTWSDAPTWGFNSIHGNSPYNAAVGYFHSDVLSTLHAEGNWWNNESRFYTASGSTGDYPGYTVGSDPWINNAIPSISMPAGGKGEVLASVASRSNSGGPEISDSSSAPDPQDSILIGVQLIQQNKRKDAKGYFMSYLSRHPDNSPSYAELYACADSETLPDLIQYFKAPPSRAPKESKLILSSLYLMQGDINSAKEVNNSIIAGNANTSLGERAKLNNFYISLYNENNPNRASAILKDVERRADLSTPMEISDAEHALQVYVDPKTGKMPNMPSSPSASQVVSQANSLVQNYPNPFNPTTVISYNLKISGHVTLKVYDVLGREVMTLVDGNQDAGIHTTSFDGSNLSSGIYFYRITAPGVNQVKKMVLLK